MKIINAFYIVILGNLRNIISNNLSRISKKDLSIGKEIMGECNMDFDNV